MPSIPIRKMSRGEGQQAATLQSPKAGQSRGHWDRTRTPSTSKVNIAGAKNAPVEAVAKQVTGRGRPAENEAQGARADRRDDPQGSRASSAPDLDMIVTVEHKIADRRLFASKSELLTALHEDIDSAKLDRVLEYLESSAKISTGNGSIRCKRLGR